MEDRLIELLEEFNYPVYRQGSFSEDEEYPDTFITYWNTDSPDHAHYDNTEYGTAWAFDVNVYSNNPEITYWYKQSMIVYVSYDYMSNKISTDSPIAYIDIVHPDNYASQVNYLQQILSGKARFIFYCYLLLKWVKSFFVKNAR